MNFQRSILLVGRDGNGKTACKRSIENISDEIEVKDFSGLGDTGSDRCDNIDTVRNNVKEILEHYDARGGFKAIGFVLKYGVRFTKQEKDAVEDVKAMLGEDVFCKHGIIIMSYGDLFDTDGGDFRDWCREQTGDIQKLFAEVNYRIVLFNNRADKEERKRKQFDELKSLVNIMDYSYTLNKFISAQKHPQAPKSYGPENLNNHNSCDCGSALKWFSLCVVILLVFLIAYVIGVVKDILWLIYVSISGFAFDIVLLILLKFKKCI